MAKFEQQTKQIYPFALFNCNIFFHLFCACYSQRIDIGCSSHHFGSYSCESKKGKSRRRRRNQIIYSTWSQLHLYAYEKNEKRKSEKKTSTMQPSTVIHHSPVVVHFSDLFMLNILLLFLQTSKAFRNLCIIKWKLIFWEIALRGLRIHKHTQLWAVSFFNCWRNLFYKRYISCHTRFTVPKLFSKFK